MIDKSLNEDEVFELWEKAPDGMEKKELLNRLVYLMKNHAFAVCYLKLGESRPDIVWKAIGSATEQLENFEHKSKFSTWFQAIVTHMCTDALRKEYNSIEDPMGEDFEYGHEPDMAGQLEAKRRVQKILMSLEPEDQEIVIMRMEGRTHEEIAERTGLTVGGACNRWMRLRERIRREHDEAA